ncbi:LytTR family DNA-binding domain-containing protein [Sphingobacterium sp. SRCM116780]|uniref:LytR/AlgR family response regulator transcription factor n=1 Tax=Sphingobacterium sp. SRCM116780 TaxID=2907623 RepID=UPI001F4242FC|nr:LytTR family DNA-binding domain-containing protein [Sphingobacterium sp. SRCM116780]UIR55675.1 LytTR family DNA-binding domain-containing protein [Sphingobacterium sp. SRCM116780]
MNKLRAIAIDDEPLALEVVKNLLDEVPFVELLRSFTKAIDTITFLQENAIDVIFLDIKMPGLSGIEFIRSLSNPPMVIFTTAYSEHAVQSFELDAIDYLLKPFSFSRLLKACNKAMTLHQLKADTSHPVVESLPTLFIKSGYEQVRIDLGDLRYIESVGNYIRFHLTDQTITSRLTMTEAEDLLPVKAFVRIHRSFIVSKTKITKIDKRSVWITELEVPIGISYAPEIENLLKNKT